MSGESVKDLTERGVRLGIRLKVDGVPPAQVNKLLEILNAERDERLALVLVSLFSHRQASRGYMKPASAREVSNVMGEILASKSSEVRAEARKVLGIAKWVYEALEGKRIPPDKVGEIKDYESLLRFLGGSQ